MSNYPQFPVAPEPVATDEISLGLRDGQSAVLKFGYNDDIDTASAEVIASFGGTFTPLTVAETMDISSSSANDTSAGTGARTLLVTGIDGSRDEQTEIVTLSGTSTVTTANTWLGINRIVVLSAGSGQVNDGDISVVATTAATNQAYVPAGTSVTQQMIYFTKAGYNALIERVSINVLKLSGGSAPRVTVRMKVFNPGVTGAIYELRRFRLDTSASNNLLRDYNPPLLLSPTDVMWMEAETDTNNTIVDAEADIVEYIQGG